LVIEAEFHAVVGEPFATQSLPRADLLEEVRDTELDDAGAHALFDVLAAASLDDDVVDSFAP
jgi:hypothetical protein